MTTKRSRYIICLSTTKRSQIKYGEALQMNQTIEHVTLDDNYSVTMVTTQLMEGVQLITCADECEATLMINDQDINLVYTAELASIIGNLGNYTAEQLLLALAQVDRLAS